MLVTKLRVDSLRAIRGLSSVRSGMVSEEEEENRPSPTTRFSRGVSASHFSFDFLAELSNPHAHLRKQSIYNPYAEICRDVANFAVAAGF